MRRKDKCISDRDEIEEILSSAKVGRLGTSFNDKPYITPLNFVHTNGKILLHSSNSGHKLDNIKANSNVCFEVEDVGSPVIKEPICASTVIYRSVIIFGTIRILPDKSAKINALKELVEKYTGKPFLESFTDSILGRVTVLEITIEEMTAKMSPAKPIAM
ncbi:MAG: pyridoxamine 5'-phosphate oxidase family protein [Candidatus Anammoxibacter sp.]